MRTMLINPPITLRERYGINIGGIAGHQMPLGLYYLSAFLKKHGFECGVIDAEYGNLSPGEIISLLMKARPDLIGITATTAAINSAVKISRHIKESFPASKIVIGGPHISALPEETMTDGAFDLGVVGEGELTFLEVVRALADGKRIDAIEGIVYKDENGVHLNKARPYIENLDILPFPLRYHFRDREYLPPIGGYRRVPVYNIITARGCPYKCVFCAKSVFGSAYRAHSPEYVISEIEELIKVYGTKEIAIFDDDFLIDRGRAFRILNLLRSRKIRIEWSCMCRPDIRNVELLKDMKEAGCWHISIGIESASQKMLDSLGKKTSISDIKIFVNAAKKLGFKIKGFVALGMPAESPDTLDDTISFVKAIDIDDICATIVTPLPGSALYRQGRSSGGAGAPGWERYTCWDAAFAPPGLSSGRLRASHRRLYKEFYGRPRIILGHMKNIKTLYSLRKYLYTLYNIIPQLKGAGYSEA